MSSGEGIPNDLNVGVAEQVRALVAAIMVLIVVAALAGFISPQFLAFTLLLTVFANLEIAALFYQKGGLFFACGALLFHQVYYLYSAAAFTFVLFEQIFSKLFRTKSPAA